MNKDLLKKLGEETLYSAKGHFKACDIRRISVTGTIWLCAIINILGVVGFENPFDRGIAAIGLFGTIALLIWNEGEGKWYRVRHKQAGEEYLALHKEIRASYFSSECTEERVQKLSRKVSEFDKSDKPDIPWIARKWAQKAIKNYNETDNWFEE